MCEGFHSKLNAAVGRRHPTVFKVIEVLKDMDDTHERGIAQLAMGAAPKRRKRKYVEVDAALTRLRNATFGGGAIPNINRLWTTWMLPPINCGTSVIDFFKSEKPPVT